MQKIYYSNLSFLDKNRVFIVKGFATDNKDRYLVFGYISCKAFSIGKKEYCPKVPNDVDLMPVYIAMFDDLHEALIWGDMQAVDVDETVQNYDDWMKTNANLLIGNYIDAALKKFQ